MNKEKKVKIYNSLFMSLLIGTSFTILGGLFVNGRVDWGNFPVQSFIAVVIGFLVSLMTPVEKLGRFLFIKGVKSGTYFFNLVISTVLIAIILFFMCPIQTLFIGQIINNAPIAALVPHLYTTYIPLILIGIIFIPLICNFIMRLSMICAGVIEDKGK